MSSSWSKTGGKVKGEVREKKSSAPHHLPPLLNGRINRGVSMPGSLTIRELPATRPESDALLTELHAVKGENEMINARMKVLEAEKLELQRTLGEDRTAVESLMDTKLNYKQSKEEVLNARINELEADNLRLRADFQELKALQLKSLEMINQLKDLIHGQTGTSGVATQPVAHNDVDQAEASNTRPFSYLQYSAARHMSVDQAPLLNTVRPSLHVSIASAGISPAGKTPALQSPTDSQ